MSCPACGQAELEVFFDAPSIPVLCNELHPSAESAISAARGDLRLGYCPACTYVGNVAFDPRKIAYTVAYENSLHFSPRFQEFAHGLADDLVGRHDLGGRDVVEIGCGKGDFLRMLVERGVARAIGFDASFEGEDESADGKVRVYRTPFAETENVAGDLVACRHVLEHIPEPAGFLEAVRRVAARRAGAVVYFEVPNGLYTFRDLGIWDLIYEHCTYFTEVSLAATFRRAGFDVLDVRPAFGDQFLCLEARVATGSPAAGGPSAPDGLAEIRSWIARFAEQYRIKRTAWESRLAELAREGRSVAVWGAGSKGVTFLNVVDASRRVRLAIDINERKQGRFVAGTGQPVVSPDEAVADRVDHVLVMNPQYRTEIEAMLSSRGSRATTEQV